MSSSHLCMGFQSLQLQLILYSSLQQTSKCSNINRFLKGWKDPAMAKNFTLCPNLQNSTLPEEINNQDFFADLFHVHWGILGFQIVFLVLTVLILPLTICFIEVLIFVIFYLLIYYIPYFFLKYENYISRTGTLLTQLNCTLTKVCECFN